MSQPSSNFVITARAPCGLVCSRCDSFIAKICSGCYSENSKARKKCAVLDGEPFEEAKNLIRCMIDKGVEQCLDCELSETCEVYETMLIRCPFKRPVHDLKPGFSYLVKEKKPELGFEVFREMVRHGIEGLCLSRTHPKYLQKKLGRGDIELFWLTSVAGKNNIDPTNIGILSDIIIQFIEKHDDTVIILDGLEFVVTHNDFSNALRMVNHISEQVMQHNARLIVTLDERTLDKKEVALLERSMEVVKG
ncbi:MAG: DUF835 domain-containing protein [Thermoplasmata archaeon]